MRILMHRRQVLEGLAISLAGWALLIVALLIWQPRVIAYDPGPVVATIRPGALADGPPQIVPFDPPPVRIGFFARRDLPDLLTVAYACTFLTVKSWLMDRRSRRRTALGASLVAVNATFAAVYYLATAGVFWPMLPLHRLTQLQLHGYHLALTVRMAARLTLNAVLTWCLIELIRTRDPDPISGDPRDAYITALEAENGELRRMLPAGVLP